MGKRVIYEQTDDTFCSCSDQHFVEDEQHSQEGGNIVARVIGEYCTNCGKDRAPEEPETEE